MNEPRAPVNDKGWNDIDIFLFSNGQQSSPPRKYHLKADELEFWEPTTHYLARTQFGSLHSTIELYTLDGKKINSPLELIDATSYVAVKPPDVFIPGGYKQYLIKASRSWEKRQEKLTNVADVTGEIKAVTAQSKTAVDESKDNETTSIKNPKTLMEKNFDSISTNNTIILRPRKDTDRSLEEKQRDYKQFLTRKSVDSDKIKIIKKNPQISHNSSKDDSIISKKRILSVSKNFKNTSSRRQSMATKNDKNNTKSNIVDSAKEKIQPNIIKEETEGKEIIVLSKPSYFHENQSRDVSNSALDKDLITTSDVFKNPDSEVQSVYIDADRKTMTREDLNKDKHKSHQLHNIEELNDELISSQKDKAISVQSITYSNDKNGEFHTTFASRSKILTINLNIGVRDSRNRDSNATDRSSRLGKCKSYTALFTAEQESQADININLKQEDFKIDNTPIRKSINSDRTYLKTEDGDTKVIIVKCMCESIEDENVYNKIKDYIVLVPTFAGYNDESCRSIPVNNQTADKDFLKTRHSILNTESQSVRSNTSSKENSQLVMKHKVSICPDSPIKISEEMPSQMKKHVLNMIANKKAEQFTQTEWCNILLQVRPQVNGYSSFYFPPLRLLTQYNLL